jgi:hypothetical protein
MRIGLITGALLASGLAGAVNAATLLPLGQASEEVQQQGQGECVIAYAGACPTTTWDFYNLNDLPGGGGSISDYDVLSPIYTVEEIINAVSATFLIGVDLNNTNEPQTVTILEVIINGIVEFANANTFTGTADDNGTGFADLSMGTIDLRSFASDDEVQFRFAVDPQNDGLEQVFLLDNNDRCLPGNFECPPDIEVIPLPTTLPLLAGGLMALGALLRSRSRKTKA